MKAVKTEKYINNKNITKYSEKVMKDDIDFGSVKIRPSKHFILGWMRKWDWDIHSIRDALQEAHKIEKLGKNKYEAYTHSKGSSRKLIFVFDKENNEIFVITGAEGK